jgi:squalene-hopene/tetraprenyl-beta-curcumene cyclase
MIIPFSIKNFTLPRWSGAARSSTGFPGYGVGERIRLSGDTSALAQGRELARGFMINYNMYRHYFPLMALGRAKKHFGEMQKSIL